MSILPSSSNSTHSSPPSITQSTNPNPNYGAQHHHQHLSQFSNSDHPPFQSLHISDHLAASDHLVSGTVAQTAQHSGGSSKKMNEARKPYGKKGYAHNTTGTSFQRQNAGQMGAASPQHRGKYEAMGSAGSQQSSGSAPSSGRKGQMVNGNHLLNFHYDPISRSRSRDSPIPPRKQQKRRPYNKDLFLQANYKFVLLDSGNYAPETMDPDKALHWEDIICVKYSTPLPVQCPICLEDPLCPQITSCGHIFCFPCILRYLAGEDDFKVECSKKCPLCFMVISVKDLYTIYIENVKKYGLGDVIEFMLLTRQKDSFTLALKNKQGMCSVEEVHDSFSKFTFTSDVDLSVREVISELDDWLAKADSNLVDDMSMLPYVCAAREQLEQRKTNWNEHQAGNGDDTSGNSSGHTRSPLAKNLTLGILTSVNDKPTGLGIPSHNSKDGVSCMHQVSDAIGSPGVCDEFLSSSYNDDKSVQMQANDFRDRKENDSYNFYQAVDGQHLILHPINLKCLLHHYGSYDRLPHRILGKIVQLETVTQSEAMRKRYRYLSHFSLTTTFQLCEIDLSDSLPLDALSPFIDEIKNREKQRKRVAKKEQEEKIKAEVAAATEFLTMPYNFAQPSHAFSPNFSMDDFEALGSSAVVSVSPPAVGERPLFSNVTRLGFAAAHDSPALKFEELRSLPRTDVASNSSPSGTQSFANVISRAKPVESKMSETGKRGKKPNRVLLSTAGGRRY